jgi:predicted phage terminase large subunit-like protein
MLIDSAIIEKLPPSELQWLERATARLEFLESKQAAEDSLAEFICQAWHIVEPGAPYVHGWHIDAICDHLEAVTYGDLNRLLINVPPGMMKSLCLNVFWPAWEWGPRNIPHHRFVCTSHSQNLAIRDSTKMRRLVQSDWYQKRWGDRVKLTGDVNAKTKFENMATGFREAVAFESMTGVRGDRVTIDDPHSVDSAGSDAMRASTVDTFLEAVPTRLNNPKESAIVVIMQRLHEGDVSGVILDKGLGYEHLMLPMEFDPARKCYTSIGFEDPRTEEGELLFPERFPREVVERDKLVMGPYAVAGQFNQSPSPRGGGIIKREWWRLYDEEEAASHGVKDGAFPPMDFIVASLDPAYTEKKENDPSALTIWGVWQRTARLSRAISNIVGERVVYDDGMDTTPAVMLMHAWQKRLPIHGPELVRQTFETKEQFRQRQLEQWGLVEHVADACKRFKVDLLLIEAKASGISVAQSIKTLHRYDGFSVQLIDPGKADKIARAYAVQAVWSGGQVYAPDRSWADMVITQCESFPRAAHDDLVDSATQAIKHLRKIGLLQRSEEVANEMAIELRHRKPSLRPVYEA